jgi:hypothetical protein
LLERLCVGPPSADKRNKQDLWWKLRHAQHQSGETKRGFDGHRLALGLPITIALLEGQKAAKAICRLG